MSSIDSQVSPGLSAGRLEGVMLPDLVWQLSRGTKTGLLEIQHDHIRRTLFVQNGRIVFAASSDPNDRLGEMLLRQGKITLDQLEDGLVRLRSGKRLGTLLVEAGALTSEQLVDAVIGQVKSVVLDVLGSTEGEYQFREGELPTQEVITLQMKTAEILLQAVRSIRSFSRLRARVGGPRSVYALSPGWRDTLDDLALSEGEKLVVGKLEAGDCAVEQLCSDLILSNFEIYQVLFGLRLLCVTTAGRRPVAQPDAGTLDPGALAELLVRLGRDRATGVLYMTRGAVERTLHLRDGRCVFATSNNPDDGLVSFLFRRGVISLHDREEVGRRLLSNKRVGTILLELGVIDDADLREMVRQQLGEIVCDTFAWHRGEFVFVAGNLPSVEAITLDRDVSTVVADGLRRVASWTRLVGGCGGIDNPLALTPTYLDQLDAMEAGVEEWEVVNAFKTPQTPRRVCRALTLGDFRICRILWTLKLLGAVVDSEELELAEPDDVGVAADSSRPSEPTLVDAAEPAKEIVTPPVVEPSPDATRRIARREVEAALRSLPTSVHGQPEETEEPRVEQPTAEPTAEKETEPSVTKSTADPVPSAPVAAAREQDAEPISEEPVAGAPIAESPIGKEAVAGPVESVRAAARRWWAKRKSGTSREEEASVVSAAAPHVVAPAGTAGAVTLPEDVEASPEVTEASAPIDIAPEVPRIEGTQTEPVPRTEVRGAGSVGESTAPPVDEPSALEPDSVEIVLDAEEAVVSPEPAAGPGTARMTGGWDLPDRIDAVILRFNAMHRVVYRAVRLEIGAGAVNFVRSCCEQVAHDSDDLIAGVELLADGSWDVDGLKSVLASKRVADPWPLYQQLLDQEFVSLQPHLDDTRAVELKQRIWELQQSAGS